MSTANSIREISIHEDAKQVAALLERMSDVDASRIAPTDDFVIRKTVLGLVAIVADLERRVVDLEASSESHGGATVSDTISS